MIYAHVRGKGLVAAEGLKHSLLGADDQVRWHADAPSQGAHWLTFYLLTTFKDFACSFTSLLAHVPQGRAAQCYLASEFNPYKFAH